jgi:hypothetical protein
MRRSLFADTGSTTADSTGGAAMREMETSMDDTATPMTEDQARDLAERAVEEAGGTRAIYRNPRHPFTLHPATIYEFDGHRVELRHGEISSPAIVSVGGWVFEIHEEEIELLIRPPKPRPAGSSCR